MNKPRVFGSLPDGRDVHSVTISNDYLFVELLTWGAVLRDLRFAGHDHPLVLGLNSIEDYLQHSRNFGATLGRCANRILGGRFDLDGQVYTLERNEPDQPNCLHGGTHGTSKSLWEITEQKPDSVTMKITDPEGNAGFPGDVKISATFAVRGTTLCIRYESLTTAATPVNIAHHGYFNLSGDLDIRDHTVEINADDVLKLAPKADVKLQICPVDGSDYDFRKPVRIGPRIARTDGFDNNYCLSTSRRPLRRVASLSAPNGISMQVATTEPGLQLFTADAVNCPVPGLQGHRYGPNSGICFETQNWPDAVNRPDFPDVILRPGSQLVQETQFTFQNL